MNKFLVFSFLFSLIGSQSLFADQCKYGPEETAKLYKQYTGSELEGDVSEAIEKLE